MIKAWLLIDYFYYQSLDKIINKFHGKHITCIVLGESVRVKVIFDNENDFINACKYLYLIGEEK